MKKFEKSPRKSEIFDSIWSELATAAKTRHHAWHLMQLATITENSPVIRTLVLRDVDKEKALLKFHTDIRSPKVTEIQNNPKVCWHAYDPKSRVQIRLSGQAEINHQDAYAQQRWESSSLNSRLCYANVHVPSSRLKSYSDLEGNSIAKQDFDEVLAEKNFAAITTKIYRVDWLYLKHQGHVRARFDFCNGIWEEIWLAP